MSLLFRKWPQIPWQTGIYTGEFPVSARRHQLFGGRIRDDRSATSRIGAGSEQRIIRRVIPRTVLFTARADLGASIEVKWLFVQLDRIPLRFPTCQSTL
jgi:hypothetical protein